MALVDGAIPGVFNLVAQDGSFYNPTVYKLTTAEGFTYTIDQKLGVTQISDLNGNTLTIGRDGVIHSSGKSIVFHRDAQGRIIRITDPQGQNLLYGYNPISGNLQSFTDRQSNTTSYGYDAGAFETQPHLLVTITDPRNVTVLYNLYDNNGKLQSSQDAFFGHVVSYNVQPAANQETITDRNGNSTTYSYDDDGNVTATIDALGHRTDMTYDAAGNKLTETRTDDTGRQLTTTFVHDAQSNLTSETDPLGNKTQYTYNVRRQVLTVLDARNKLTTNAYDNNGNLLSTVDPLGNKTVYTYFSTGLPQTVTDANHNATSFAYDNNGNLTRQTDALGNVSSFTYDANNNKLTQTVTRTKADGTQESLLTQYVYDGNNRLIKTIAPDGSSSRTVYNAIGKQSDAIDALGRTTHYDYDNNGRLTAVTYPDQTQDAYTYDNEGHRTQQYVRQSLITNYTYDKLGRLTQTTQAVGIAQLTAYDALGRVKSTTDANNNVTTYVYDDAGRRTQVTDALGHVSKFTYDAAGNQTQFTDALNHTTKYVYDDAGRRTQTIFPDQTTETISYDSLGRQIAKTDQAGKTTQFGYDPLGRLITVTDALNQVTSYGYDELGNRITQTDANQHTTKFVYDQLGRRVSRKLPLGMSESYSYNAVGSLTSKTDFNGHTTTYSYDSMNRLLSKTADAFFSTGACAPTSTVPFPCGATQISYTYTPTGRRKTMTDAVGQWTYTYDGIDRLTNKSNPLLSNAPLHWSYDPVGNITGITSTNIVVAYGYDALNRLTAVSGGAAGTPIAPVTYSYDAVGNLAGTQIGSVFSTSYTYDPLNRLTNMQSTCGTTAAGCGPAGTANASYAYTLGPAGNRLSVQELSGRTVQYGYDDLYRLTSETIAGAATQNGTVSYQYDTVGNRKQLNSTLPAVPTGLLNYDANDRIATQVYDNNGNTVNNGIQNVYDFENRLVQRGNVQIVYDGDGNRVQENVGGTNTLYQVAEINPTGYAQVLEERPNNLSSSANKVYVWGLQLVAMADTSQYPFVFPSPVHYYGYDGHGSVRYLIDPTGKTTDTYDYDAFGNLIAQTGATQNNYLFAGEQFDPALGVYYNRARYYDERLGRFWSADTFEGDPRSPASLHKYLYANANPVTRVDPSGFESLVEATESAAIEDSLQGQSVLQREAVKKSVNTKIADVYFVLRFSVVSILHAYIFVNVTAIGAGYKYEVQPDLEETANYFLAASGSPIGGTLSVERETLRNVKSDWRNLIAKKIASFSPLQWAAWTGTVKAVAPFTTGIIEVPYSLLGLNSSVNCLKFAVVAAFAAIAEERLKL